MNNAIISIRTDLQLKNECQEILREYGLTISSAFNQYMAGIRSRRIQPAVYDYTVKPELMKKWERELQQTKKSKMPLLFSDTKKLMEYLES